MAPISGRKAGQIARDAAGVVAVELIAAAQGIDCHAPLRTSKALHAVHAKVREHSPHLVSDRYWSDEMAALQAAVLSGEFGTFFFQAEDGIRVLYVTGVQTCALPI